MRSGVYFALHSEHRVVQELTILRGQLFPQCRICGARVTFRLWQAGEADAAELPSILVPYSHGVVSFEGLAI
jgi:hypothetical protein